MRCELGTLVQRAGIFSKAQVEEAQTIADAHGILFAEALVGGGQITEEALARFAQRKLMIPRVPPAVLARVEPSTASCVTRETAWQHHVLPVAIDRRNNLTLAMVDPTDIRAVKEVAERTHCYVIRAATQLTPLRAAITRCLGVAPPQLAQTASDVVVRPATTFRRAPATVHDAPSTVAPARATVAPTGPSVAPPQATVVKPRASVGHPRWGVTDGAAPDPALAALLLRLRAASDQGTLMKLLLDFLGRGFARVLVLLHSRGELRGHAARGDDTMKIAATGIRLIVRRPSIFASVIKSGHPYFGPMPQNDDTERIFAGAVGGISGNMLLVPVRTADAVPLLIFANPAISPVDPRSIDRLSEAMGEALERISPHTTP
ncbi:MAG: hypothetical protein V3V08_18760 [Nannocystaceae bacterium]